MSSPQPIVNPPASHRFFTVTPDDHRGQIWTTTIIFGIFAVLVLCMRGFIGRGNLGRDDWSAAAATVLEVGQLGCILAAASGGLGQMDGGTRGTKVGSLTMASEAILVLGLALAKCSVIFLVRRIASASSLVCDAFLGLSVLGGLASLLLITVRCSPSHIIGVDGFCEQQLLRWEVITVVDSTIEIGIFMLVLALVRPLQMKLQKKVVIAMAFSLRLPVIILAILHVVYVHRFLSSPAPTVAVANIIILQQVELSYSLMSSSIARLNAFLKVFNSGMGLGLKPELCATGRRRGDYELSYLKKRSLPETGDTELLRLTSGNGGYTSTISHGHPKSKLPSSEGIRRDFHVRVSYEDVLDPA